MTKLTRSFRINFPKTLKIKKILTTFLGMFIQENNWIFIKTSITGISFALVASWTLRFSLKNPQPTNMVRACSLAAPGVGRAGLELRHCLIPGNYHYLTCLVIPCRNSLARLSWLNLTQSFPVQSLCPRHSFFNYVFSFPLSHSRHNCIKK